MTLNDDSMKSFDEIGNIIPSPVNCDEKVIFIEEESKLGKIEKEIDSFGDISGINKENNEIINDNYLININVNKENSAKKEDYTKFRKQN